MIYLLRHGLDDEKYIGGWSNVSLIKEGKEQIVKSSKFIKNNLKINQIITSDIKRCVDSSDIVRNIIGDVPLIKSDLVRELNKGNYNGRLREKLSFLETVLKNELFCKNVSIWEDVNVEMFEYFGDCVDRIVSGDTKEQLQANREFYVYRLYEAYKKIGKNEDEQLFLDIVSSLHNKNNV